MLNVHLSFEQTASCGRWFASRVFVFLAGPTLDPLARGNHDTGPCSMWPLKDCRLRNNVVNVSGTVVAESLKMRSQLELEGDICKSYFVCALALFLAYWASGLAKGGVSLCLDPLALQTDRGFTMYHILCSETKLSSRMAHAGFKKP